MSPSCKRISGVLPLFDGVKSRSLTVGLRPNLLNGVPLLNEVGSTHENDTRTDTLRKTFDFKILWSMKSGRRLGGC